MKCPHCESEVPPTSAYCSQCGQRLAADNATVSELPIDGSRPSANARSPYTPRGDQGDEAERELWQDSYSPKAMVGVWLMASMEMLTLLIVGAFVNLWQLWALIAVVVPLTLAAIALLTVYRRLTIRYRLTSQRFFQERGLLSRVTERIEVIDVDDITLVQGPVERFLTGTGTIHVVSSDRTDPDLSMPGIANVHEVANLLDDARRAERRRRGVHIEAV